MKILVACEESQVVTIELRKFGHEAYSCDILPCSGGHQEWHFQDDVIKLLIYRWDMIIAFPPCTHLAVSGARWFKEKQKDGRQRQSIDFFMEFVNCKCDKVAIENPIGIMSTKYRKPDQIIQPWQFGDRSRKATCLWLKNLSKLKPTMIVKPDLYITKKGKTFSRDYLFDKNGKWTKFKGQGKRKSVFYKGIASAMAEQWARPASIYAMIKARKGVRVRVSRELI